MVKSYSGWYEVRPDDDGGDTAGGGGVGDTVGGAGVGDAVGIGGGRGDAVGDGAVGAPAVGSGSITCQPRGRLRQAEDTVLTGDRVRLTLLDDGSGVIEEILPRKSELRRPSVANVDQVVIVFTLRQPPLNRPVLDRLACLAETVGLGVILVLNKMDLVQPAVVAALAAEYEPTGYPFLAVSAQPPLNVEALRPLLADRVSVLAGPSGVGKSTLLNALEPGLQLRTQRVSSRLRQGRHTTRHVQLLPIYARAAADKPAVGVVGGEGAAPQGAPLGYVVDTPGFSQLSIDQVAKEDLVNCFPEMKPLADSCRFADCLHRAEPGCAVKAAVAAGRIAAARHEQYLRLLDELEELERQRYR